jgi:hypothetical protein
MTDSTSNLTSGTALGVALAWATTTVVYVIGNLGAPIRVVTGWAPDGADLRVAEYLITSAVAVAAATLALWLLRRRGAERAWAPLVAIVSVASAVPLWWLDVDTGSKLSLTMMHLLTGTAAVTGHALARRQSAVRNRATVRSHDSVEAAAS